MASPLLITLLLLAAPGAASNSLRSAPVKSHGAEHPINVANTAATKVAPVTAAPAKAAPIDDGAVQVTNLRAKLVKISGGLTKMLSPSGELIKTKIADVMAKFSTELQSVLKQTEKPKDMKKALKQLQDAQAGVQALTKDITQQQVRLMSEGDAQEESLLLGVLMQRQKEPMSKQLEVLEGAEFAKLKVVSAVLAAKDTKTPLFQQVATYLDKHSPKPVAAPKVPEIPDKLIVGKDGKPDVTPIVLALEGRLQKMEENEEHMEKHHLEEMKELARVAEEKKKSATAVRQIKKMEHSEQRQFAKQSGMGKHDIQAIKSAIEAVRKGDLTALTKAQGALDASMKAAQARTGKFLVLIQMVHQAEGRDCPYCAAQCVDKCHSEGKSYITCMTDCADAGK